ncbi:MAG: MtnX-like HAD-IB family phosphatase [Candidatus Heimdallarchaeaceae archaeon]
MKVALCCDFDGTITLTDTGKELLSTFSQSDWQYYDKLVIQGKIGTRDSLLKQWATSSDVTEKDFNRIVDTIQIDPTFLEFYEWVRKKNFKFIILSDGFESYITRILLNHNISPATLDIKANNMKIINGRIKLEFLTEPCEHNCANCKYSHVQQLISEGFEVIYIGDGLSDILPAQKLAKIIFARDGDDLAKVLKDDERLHHFSDFLQIRKTLEEMGF